LFRGEVRQLFNPGREVDRTCRENPNRAASLPPNSGADFVTDTADPCRALQRPEVNAHHPRTDEHCPGSDPGGSRARHSVADEKRSRRTSAQSHAFSDHQGRQYHAWSLYARFPRNWLSGKWKVRSVALGDVRLVPPRFMYRPRRDRQLQSHRRSLDHLKRRM